MCDFQMVMCLDLGEYFYFYIKKGMQNVRFFFFFLIKGTLAWIEPLTLSNSTRDRYIRSLGWRLLDYLYSFNYFLIVERNFPPFYQLF